jgi:hypothetical protein
MGNVKWEVVSFASIPNKNLDFGHLQMFSTEKKINICYAQVIIYANPLFYMTAV